MGRGDARLQAHLDVVLRHHLVDQVARHALVERVAAAEDRDLRGVAREVHRRLAGGVRAADHHDALVLAGDRLGHRRAVVDAAAGELLDARRLQAAVGHPRRHQHRMAGQLGAVAQAQHPRRPAALDAVHAVHRDDLRAQPARLRRGPPGEVAAAEPAGEAEVVLDARALPGLAARRLALHHHGAQALRGPVDRRGQPGGAAADDHQVVERQLGAGGQAHLLGDLERARPLQHGAVGEQQDGQAVGAHVGYLEQLRRLALALHVQPAEGDLVAGEEVAQLVRLAREAVAHDAHRRLRDAARGRPVGQQVVDHREQLLLGRVPGLEQVVVEVHVVDRLDRGLGVGVGGEQHALGRREQRPRLLQQLHSAHAGHALVGHREGQGRAAQLELVQ